MPLFVKVAPQNKVPVALPFLSITAEFFISGNETKEMRKLTQCVMNNVWLKLVSYPGLQT